MVRDVRRLVGRQRVVEHDRHATRVLDSEVGDQWLGPIARQKHRELSGLEPKRGQADRYLRDCLAVLPPRERLPGAATVLPLDGIAVSQERRGLGERAEQRFARDVGLDSRPLGGDVPCWGRECHAVLPLKTGQVCSPLARR